MKKFLIIAILLMSAPVYAQEKPLTAREYATNALGQKESIIMQLLDELVVVKGELSKTKEELKKYKDNSWLP